MSMTFPTYVKGCLEIIMTPFKAWVCLIFFLVSAALSLSKFTCLFDGFSACHHQVHPSCLSLQASWVKDRLIFCMLAVGTTTCMQKMHMQLRPWSNMSAPVSKKGYVECDDFFGIGIYDMSIESLLAFFPSDLLFHFFLTPLQCLAPMV